MQVSAAVLSVHPLLPNAVAVGCRCCCSALLRCQRPHECCAICWQGCVCRLSSPQLPVCCSIVSLLDIFEIDNNTFATVLELVQVGCRDSFDSSVRAAWQCYNQAWVGRSPQC